MIAAVSEPIQYDQKQWSQPWVSQYSVIKNNDRSREWVNTVWSKTMIAAVSESIQHSQAMILVQSEPMQTSQTMIAVKS